MADQKSYLPSVVGQKIDETFELGQKIDEPFGVGQKTEDFLEDRQEKVGQTID